MMLELGAHLLFVGVLAAAAAWLAEGALRRLRLPGRGVWLLAVVLTVGIPVSSMFRMQLHDPNDAGASPAATAGMGAEDAGAAAVAHVPDAAMLPPVVLPSVLVRFEAQLLAF